MTLYQTQYTITVSDDPYQLSTIYNIHVSLPITENSDRVAYIQSFYILRNTVH